MLFDRARKARGAGAKESEQNQSQKIFQALSRLQAVDHGNKHLHKPQPQRALGGVA